MKAWEDSDTWSQQVHVPVKRGRMILGWSPHITRPLANRPRRIVAFLGSPRRRVGSSENLGGRTAVAQNGACQEFERDSEYVINALTNLESPMVAKCANPSCNREFRELSKGRLFLLPPVHTFAESMNQTTRLIDHCYWLCQECATTYVVGLEDNHPVISRRQPLQAVQSASAAA